MNKDFDLILYGATGAVGRQAAAYFAAQAPPALRWAVAGRQRSTLDALGLSVPILLADAHDAAALDALAERARVVLNMAGPFRLYGDPLLEACIRQGTHYCDISGETARIRDLIDRHHAQAAERRLRIVPFCGASSVPADIAVHLLAGRLGGSLPQVKAALRLEGGSFSGGTIRSIGEAQSSGDAKREADPFLLGPNDRSPEPVERDPRGIRYDRELGAWALFSPLGVSDTRAVRRSAVLREWHVVFQEYLAFDSAARAAATWGVLGGFRAAMRWRPTRSLLGRLADSGEKSDDKWHDSSYDLRVVGNSADGRRASVRVHGIGDAGNRITVLCAYACALTLAIDEPALPEVFGVVTPSVAMGDHLVARLRAAGLSIEVDDLQSSNR